MEEPEPSREQLDYEAEQTLEAQFQEFRRKRAEAPTYNAAQFAQEYAGQLWEADAKFKGQRFKLSAMVMHVDLLDDGTPVLYLMNHQGVPGVAAILNIAPNDDRFPLMRAAGIFPLDLYCGGEGFNARIRMPVVRCGLYTSRERDQEHYPGWRGLKNPAASAATPAR